MAERSRNWTEEEITLALELYFRTPFGKIDKKNPDIIKLAGVLNRTPSAVGFKMVNLAHFDPIHIARGVTGLSHGSKLDYYVYTKYVGKWEELAFDATKIRSSLEDKPLESYLIDSIGIPLGKEREAIIKVRVGQDFFRSAVLAAYGDKCCITGMANKKMLIASHIKPWSCSTARERTNPCNGLSLNSFFDRAFDQGLITVNLDYKVKISKELNSSDMDEATERWMKSYDGASIILPRQLKPCNEFLEYHNDVIFKG